MTADDKPQFDWTREQREEWIMLAEVRLEDDIKGSYGTRGCNPVDRLSHRCQEAAINRQKAIIDESSSKSKLAGFVILAVQRFEQETGMKVGTISIDGINVEVSE